jgi:hypothetical protein
MNLRTAIAGAAVATVLLVGGAAIFQRGDDPTARSPAGGSARAPTGDVVTTPLSAARPSLLYLVRGSLRAIDLHSGRKQSLGELSADVAAAAPRGPWVASVVPLDPPPPGDREFVVEPELRLLDTSSGRETTIGPGFAPMWGPDAETLVYLRPTGPRRCSGEVCSGRSEVVALDVATGNETTLLESGRWGLLSWLGGEVLVSDAADLERALAVSPERRVRRLSLAPSEVWAGSPDGEWLVAVRAGRPLLYSTGEDTPGTRADPVSTGGGFLAAGAWAPDSSLVAAVVVGAGSGERPVVFAPTDLDPVPLRGLTGATGPILWSQDARVVVIPGRDRGKQHVGVCDVEQRSCRRLMPYGRNVSLVGVVGG